MISNNCKNADEGHEFCWTNGCECSCHINEPISDKDVVRNEDGDEVEI